MTGRPASKDIRPGDFALSVGMPDESAPPGWEWVALSDVATMATGHTPSRKHPEYWSDASIRWVTATDANPADGGVINETRQKINQLGLDNSAAVLLPEGTVCLSRTGASIGYTVILGQRMATSQGFVNWICSSGLEKWYLLYLLMSERRALFSFGEGSAHATIYFPVAKAFHICLPPYNEQRRIVAKLEELFSDLDAGVAALERAKANLKRYRAAVLKAAVEGKLTEEWRAENPDVEPASELLERILVERRERWEAEQLAKYEEKGKKPPKGWEEKYKEPAEPDVEGLPELPEGWCWTSLGQCFDVRVGATPSRKSASYWNGTIPWVSSGEVQFGRISSTRETITAEGLQNSSTRLNPAGSVLLGMIGEGKTRGQTAILEIPACNNQNCAAICVSMTPILSEFVYYWLWSQYEVTRTRGSGNNQPALNKTRVERIPLPLPPVHEQESIVRTIEALLSNVESSENLIRGGLKRSTRLRKSILKRAFEGKLVPQDLNDEPASELLERIKAEREAAEANGKKKRKQSRTRRT